MQLTKKLENKRKNHISEGAGYYVVQVMIYVLVGAFALCTVLPFIYILAGSFATERQLTESSFFLFPNPISLNAYKYILDTGDIFKGLKNSLILTVIGTAFSMFVTTTFAYALSRRNLRGRNIILNMVIVTMIFSGGMIPSYLVVDNLKLTNTFWALILPGSLNAFNMIILKNFFQEIPKELEEAATLDGATDMQVFIKVFLPLATASIASVALFYAVSYWNSYFNAMLYINDPAKEVAQIVLRRITLLAGGADASGATLDFGFLGEPPAKSVKLATTLVATIPILMVYPFIQKYFTKGVMVGAVKG